MKPFLIFNTLTRGVEEFHPLNPPAVTYYSCGPTVYLPQHLGNMRCFLFYDTLRRALEYNGYAVRQVMNITDVGHMTEDSGEDKVEKSARESGKSPGEIADFYIAMFKRDLARLRAEPAAALPRATDHVPEMIALISRIIARGYAYAVKSGVYFDVEKWRGAARTGRLSRQSLDEQQAGLRLDHKGDKRSPHDFALWVLDQPGHLMQWDSPWGRGYPGWHIECSAMAMKYLGETIDLHSGGMDHIAIHHENEIAQSESATGVPFVRYWVHNAFLVGMEGAKIAKSAGRFPVLDDVIAAGLDPLAFRLFCMGAKYRSELAFSLDAVRAAQSNLDYLREFARGCDPGLAGADDAPWVAEYAQRFHEAINSDLNTPQALAAVREMVARAYRDGDKRVWGALSRFDRVLGLGLDQLAGGDRAQEFPPAVARLIDERAQTRQAKNFRRADELRRELEALGYEVKDHRDGTSTCVPRRGRPGGVA